MNQKRENLLNLALSTDETQRMQTEDLNVGYDSEQKTWEVIVKYHGQLAEAVAQIEATIVVEELIAGYAILTIPESYVNVVTELEEIEYMELPKRFFYDMDMAMNWNDADGMVRYQMDGLYENSCLQSITQGLEGLHGKGVAMLIPDSGIDWSRGEFRNADGSTRIAYLWDQALGIEYEAEQINEALNRENKEGQFIVVPSIDVSGHGTAVAGIAAGNNLMTGYKGVAPEATLLIVKLGIPKEGGFPRTTEIMRAVSWGLKKAEVLKMPMVVNLSLGNNYGPHDGTSILERFLDNAAEVGRTVICVGSGNEAASGTHTGGRITQGGKSEFVRQEFIIGNYERNLRLQLWQSYSDAFRIYLTAPSGEWVEVTAPIRNGKYEVQMARTKLLIYQGEPTPYATAKELYLEFLPEGSLYLENGIWSIIFEPIKIVTGRYDLYLSDGSNRSANTSFLKPIPEGTFTIPSTATKVITVGAYDSVYQAYADFSGRGYVEREVNSLLDIGLVKPDLVAPGVDILVPNLYGGYELVTGTSFATPIVSGAAVLLMEWGIVRGNDPFLYGEKIKAYLRAGAKPIRGEDKYPNNKVGFGALCLQNSF